MSNAGWRSRVLAGLIACAVGCGDSEPPAQSSPDAPTGPNAPSATDVRLRFVNTCASGVDVYLGDDASPLVSGIQRGAITEYVDVIIRPEQAALGVRLAGSAPETAPTGLELLEPILGKEATVVLRGFPCSTKTLWDDLAEMPENMLRVWFADASGSRSPVRLYMETADTVLTQVAAIETLGGTVGDGALVAAAPSDSRPVRFVVVLAEFDSSPDTPGYDIPGNVLVAGRRLFMIFQGSTLRIVGEDGPPPELPAKDGDPAGLVKPNPTIAIMNAVPDLCGNGTPGQAAQFVVAGEADRQLANFGQVGFGRRSTRSLRVPTTATGHSIVATAAAGCSGPAAGIRVSTGPLHAGESLKAVILGSATDGTLQLLRLPDRPSDTTQLAFVNAVLASPPLTPARDDGAGGASAVIAPLPFGMVSSWISNPGNFVLLLERPEVKLGVVNSSVMVMLGDWRPERSLPVQIAPFSYSN